MLKELHLKQVGPAPKFDIEFGPRTNLLTGDNGLGKTFLLDVAWWALTRTWVGDPAWPQPRRAESPEISYRLMDLNSGITEPLTHKFDYAAQHWGFEGFQPTLFSSAIVIYVRVDGGFSVSDPARNRWHPRENREPEFPGDYHFSSEALWNGLGDSDKSLPDRLVHRLPFELLRLSQENVDGEVLISLSYSSDIDFCHNTSLYITE